MKRYLSILTTVIACALLFGLLALPFIIIGTADTRQLVSGYQAISFDQVADLTAYSVFIILAMINVVAAFVTACVTYAMRRDSKGNRLTVMFMVMASIFLIAAMICNIVFCLSAGARVGVAVILPTISTIILTIIFCLLNHHRHGHFEDMQKNV